MSDYNHTNNSINQLLQIFKQFQHEPHPNPLFTSQTISTPRNRTQRTQISKESDFFSKEQQRIAKFGLHSSLERVNRSKDKRGQFSSRGSHAMTDTCDGTIFSRLYNENKALREKRERLFQEGRRSIEAKQNKECTFSPNLKVRTRTERSVSEEDSDAFYLKNLEWQSKRQMAIKRKQCDRNSGEKDQLTFAPKIHSFKKKPQRGQANKENNHYASTRKNDSYLQNYHKSSQQASRHRPEPLETQKSCVNSIRQGYFSYVV